ncbi:unnamed protein product, partial [Oikopleura dioica]
TLLAPSAVHARLVSNVISTSAASTSMSVLKRPMIAQNLLKLVRILLAPSDVRNRVHLR